MKIYSETYPGIVVICPQCYALLAPDPHKDFYEERYCYCPLCKEKIDTGVREVSWRPAVENKIEETASNSPT